MANQVYYRARAKWAQAQLNWVTDDIRALCVTSGYTPDFAAHEFLSAILSGNRLGAAQALSNKAVQTDGRMTCDNVRFTSMPSSGTMQAVVLYKHNASEAAAPLLYYLDSAASGLPLIMDGKDVVVAFPAVGVAVL